MLATLFEYNSIQKTFRSSFYIPSERAGVLEMYKSIIPGILDSTSSYRDHTQSTMSEFIAQLLFLEDKRGVFADTVDDMSQDITGGRINIERHQMAMSKTYTMSTTVTELLPSGVLFYKGLNPPTPAIKVQHNLARSVDT